MIAGHDWGFPPQAGAYLIRGSWMIRAAQAARGPRYPRSRQRGRGPPGRVGRIRELAGRTLAGGHVREPSARGPAAICRGKIAPRFAHEQTRAGASHDPAGSAKRPNRTEITDFRPIAHWDYAIGRSAAIMPNHGPLDRHSGSSPVTPEADSVTRTDPDRGGPASAARAGVRCGRTGRDSPARRAWSGARMPRARRAWRRSSTPRGTTGRPGHCPR
jgi:hypothetical protein